MVDDRLLRRIDLLLLLVGGFVVLTLVIASLALMLFSVPLGLLALAAVVLTAVIGALSYARAG
jgi:hypothetical protein